MYKILNKQFIEKDSKTIPVSNGNKDYREYLQWLSEGNKPEIGENSFLKINETQASPEKWTKEGEEDSLTQPMIAERWSDGITTVWAAEDVPLVDGEPDADFVYFAATQDDSWTYVPAVEYSWEIVDDEDAIKQDQANKVLDKIRVKRDVLIVEADANVNKHIDGDSNAVGNEADWKAYRIALRDCTEPLKEDGVAKLSTADIDPETFEFPAKP
jgi:hypothetical protein